ncbi:hypothetical protein BsWGS_27166 [Bradybaena similaris]
MEDGDGKVQLDTQAQPDTQATKFEILVQQLEEFKLAKQKLICREITSYRTEKCNHCKEEPALACSTSNQDLTKCWHRFIHKNSDSADRQNTYPCFCQRIGQWSPFLGINQHSLHTWIKDRPNPPREPGVPPEIHFRSPRLFTPVMSGDCQKDVAMNARLRRSLDDSLLTLSSSKAEREISTREKHQTLNTPVITNSESHNQISNMGDTSPWESSVLPLSQDEVVESMYVLSKDEADTNACSLVCSCHRPPKLILCKSCGHTLTGRVRKRCQIHAKKVYLMDLLHCTQCESQDLKEV